MELKKIAEKAVNLRVGALKLVSKNTLVGKGLRNLFPIAIITLLGSSFLHNTSITHFDINIYLNCSILLSLLVVLVFSFFSESLFETDEELENYVKRRMFPTLIRIFL